MLLGVSSSSFARTVPSLSRGRPFDVKIMSCTKGQSGSADAGKGGGGCELGACALVAVELVEPQARRKMGWEGGTAGDDEDPHARSLPWPPMSHWRTVEPARPPPFPALSLGCLLSVLRGQGK